MVIFSSNSPCSKSRYKMHSLIPVIVLTCLSYFSICNYLFRLFLVFAAGQFHISLIISKNPQIVHLSGNTIQRILHTAVTQIPFKVNKETIFPLFLRNRTGFDLCHIQIIIDKMGQCVIQTSTLMWNLKTYTDFSCFFLINLFFGYDNKPCGILPTGEYMRF